MNCRRSACAYGYMTDTFLRESKEGEKNKNREGGEEK